MSESVKQSDIQEGYKQVQLGPKSVKIPSEWTVRKLDELTSNSGNYGANISAVDYDPEKPRYIRITDIGDDGFLKDDDRKSISREDAEDYYLSEGDLLFARTGATAGKSYLCREDEPDAAYAGYLIRFEVDRSKVDPDFLALYVQSKLYENWVDRITRHGAQENINASEYRSLDILYPPLSEQRRIAGILSTVDKQIQQTDEMVEKTKELKRGLMQDLYTRGTKPDRKTRSTRIGEIPINWTLATIGQYAEIISGTHVKSDLVSDDESLTPYITGPADFTRNGIQVSKYTDSPSSFCEEGDTLVTVKGMSCGKSTFADSPVSISRQLKAIRPGADLDEKYLFYWVRYKQQLLYVLAEGTRQLGLSTSDIASLPIPIPPSEEQEQIGDLLSKVDEKVSQEIQSKQHFQDLKRGLMQDLLTGTVRVNADA